MGVHLNLKGLDFFRSADGRSYVLQEIRVRVEESPNYEDYSHSELLDEYSKVDGRLFPEIKQRLRDLINNAESKTLNKDKSNEKYETFSLRFAAAITDAGLFWLIGDGLEAMQKSFSGNMVVTHFIEFIGVFSFITYSIILHALYGQTLGKKLWGVKVVNYSDETSISFKQAIIRDSVPLILVIGGYLLLFANLRDTNLLTELFVLLWMFSNIIWAAAELFSALSNPKRRAVHDYMARTIVVCT